MVAYVVFGVIISFLFHASISLANSLRNNHDQSSVDVPLVDSLNAPLTAQLNLSQLNKQIESLIVSKVKKEVSEASEELMNSLIENKTKEVEERLKSEITEQITSEPNVALTACASGLQTAKTSVIIKFSVLKNSYGIQNIDSFKQTGIFTCERMGLYGVFASMVTRTQYASFKIFKNSAPLGVIYVSYSPNDIYESGSGMATTELNVGDKVSVRANTNNIAVHQYSCYSLFKIK